MIKTLLSLVCGPVLCCAVASSALADAPRVLPKGQVPRDVRLGPTKDLNGYFPFTPYANREAWARRAEALRRQILVAAGLWPMPQPVQSEPTIHGKIDRGDYTVEKVILETYPGYYLTGNLYRSKRSGKQPGVLCPHGHWPNGRFTDLGEKELREQISKGAERFEIGGRSPLQARCMQLARMGCVVFHYDMIGYADSKQLDHHAGVRPQMNDPKRWGFCSPQAEARLQTFFGLQTYNSIRALDFISALPDVDPSRIGVTGASGGGTQTFILCAVDPRPTVAFPAVMVSTAMQGGCNCENASYLRIGTGNIEIAALMAPKPLGMAAADDWTKEIATKGLPELKQHYRMFGAEDMVMAKPQLQFPHNYNYVTREVMYHWFNKHLKLGLPEPIVEEDYRPLSIAEMSVWDASHPAPAGGDDFERSFVERMTADTKRQIDALTPRDEASLREYAKTVGGAVQVMIGRELPSADALEADDVRSQDIGPCQMTTFLLRNAARSEEVPAIRLQPKQWNNRTVIWVDGQGKQALFAGARDLRPAVRRLLEKGYAVLSADLMGQGEFTADGKPLVKARLQKYTADDVPENAEWARYAGYTFGYNSPLFSQRVHDILSLVSWARGGKPAGANVDVVGLGGAGPLVAAARAIAGKAIDRAAIDTAGFRFANLTALDNPEFLPGIVKYGDVPAMIALSAPLRLFVMGEDDASLAVASAAYRAAGHSDQLTVLPGKAAQGSPAIEWLLNNQR